MKRTELQVKGELIAGCLLTDTSNALRELDRAGGIPPGVRFDGDAGAVIAEAAKIPRDIHGDEAALLLMRAVEGVGVSGPRWDKLADRGLTFEIAGHVADLLAHVRDVEGLKIINTPGDAGFKLMELQRVYGAAAADTRLQIVDAGSYIDTEPPAHDPIIEGLFEAGDKVGVIASAKRKKTWFVLQLAIACAAPRPFLGWTIPRARRVLIIQPEIKEAHYHRRMRFTARALGVTVAELGGRLGVVNARGVGIEAQQIKALAKRWHAELVIVDPLYKLTTGDENKAQDVKPILAAFDEIATETGAAVLWVHHDSKGAVGDRDSRDRGAGSNVLIRDVDQLFTLTPHRDDPEATVLETLARNYADEGRKTVKWNDGAFEVDAGLIAIPRTSANVSQYADTLRQLDATEPGLSLAAAAERLGCDRSTVSRLRKQRGVA